MKLGRKLTDWQEANLITAEQASAILTFERQRSGSTSWIVLALGAIGALAVVTGLISLIAANWDDIPAAIKLAGALLLLVGSLMAAYGLSRAERTLASDLFLAGHAGLVLATIGLVGQVYHLSGAPWRALAVAAAMTVPAALIAERSIVSDVAIGYALAALALFLGDSRGERPWLDGFGWCLLAASIGGAMVLAADPLERLHPPFVRALRRWGPGLLFATAVVAAVAWSVSWSGPTRPPMIVLATLLAAVWIARTAWERSGALALGTVALAALILGAALIGNGHRGGWQARDPGIRFVGFALFCAAGGSFAVAAARLGSRRLTNLFTLAVAARVLVLFLEVLSTLAMTGFGLLLTGAVFCAIAWAWWRLHRVLPVNEARP